MNLRSKKLSMFYLYIFIVEVLTVMNNSLKAKYNYIILYYIVLLFKTAL